ncbi:MAG: hypothetical protein ACREJP_04105, partial [Candidatus Methylomirabilales bacterium]
SGSARALDLTAPLLRTLPAVGGLFNGLTLGATLAKFSDTSISGAAVASCQLIEGANILGLLPCDAFRETSSSAGSPGDSSPTCVQNQAILNILTIRAACANSYSSLLEGILTGNNAAGVADLGMVLDLLPLKNLLNVTVTKDALVGQLSSVVSSVLEQVKATTSQVAPLAPVGNLTDAVKDAVSQLLDTLKALPLDLGQAVKVISGISTTDVATSGSSVAVTSQAAGAKVGLLGIQDAFIDGLLIIDVSLARATAIFDGSTGMASGSVDPAVATLKVKNLLNLPGLGDYLTLPVQVPTLNNLLAPLNNTLLATEVKPASSSVSPSGRSVSASTSGVEIHALKGLGAASPGGLLGCGSCDGGIRVRVAAADAAIGGALVQAVAPPLPVTGGTLYAFVTGAVVLAAGSPLVFGLARRLRRAKVAR